MDIFEISDIRSSLESIAVDADSAPMAAYMKHRFPFLGIRSPARKAATAELLRAARRADASTLLAFANDCWAQPEREFHYVGSDALKVGHRNLSPADLDDLADLAMHHAWWDTVDQLASWPVGSIVARHPEATEIMDEWIGDDNFWLARVALLHQLRSRSDTDLERVFRYALQRGSDSEFFIRKAVGWSLRQAAHSFPDEVAHFVHEHGELSPLSRREALKHL